ncbi:MAG: helix-turn-helix domain-containing protein [Prevotella sp.]|nr:helix-turn-helix domain-containing protein [Prevotella sp.]
MKLIATLLMVWMGLHGVWSQPLCTVVKYDEADGVSSSHITQLLQDEQGFMWFATWNGLCRYDGYEFQTFKPAVGDGCHMTTDRIRNIDLLPDGRILCRADDDYAMFSLHDYRFRDLTSDERQKVTEWTRQYRQSQSMLNGRSMSWTDVYQTQWTLHGDGQLTYRLRDGSFVATKALGLAASLCEEPSLVDNSYPLPLSPGTLSFAMTDRQGNFWVLDDGNIYKFYTGLQRTHRLAIEPREEVKCLFADQQGHYWVATKGDQALRIYNSSDDRLLGYLGSDGRIHQSHTRFGAAVYCMYQANDGALWLGTKPDGIFRLRPSSTDGFRIDHLTSLPMTDVYHIEEDRYGRLWVATLDGGICYTDNPNAEKPHFAIPKQFPKDIGQRVRYLHFTKNDIMLAATGNGLWVARLEQNADKMQFRLHQRESKRASSLNCSATMDVTEDAQGRLFVSTESGGINQIMSSDLLADTLSFRHFNDIFHAQGNDIVQSLTLLQDKRLMAVGSHQVTLIDSTFHGRVLDARYFQDDYRFSEASPLALSGNRWLFGLMDGAFITTMEQMTSSTTSPRIVLTSVSVQGGSSNYAIEMADTIVLAPDERSLTVRFAAIDYSASERISYAFRLSTDKQWHYIGHDRSATLLDLKPDTYLLEIRSTNADSEWLDNIRTLTIIVRPTFWEAWYGQLLIIFLCVALLAAIVYTYLYIRRIKRQHQQTLEAYLTLFNKPEGEVTSKETAPIVAPTVKAEDDALLKRVMKFIEENISDADIGVGDLAAAAAVSRSGLQRKLKQTMGITPQELLSEARIKRACQLLQETDKPVSEIAYACGFNDPKYFSKCFKQSTGKTPSEFKNMP